MAYSKRLFNVDDPLCYSDLKRKEGSVVILTPSVARGKNLTGEKVKQYYVYTMTNRSGTLYTGVTSDLEKRVYEHKHKMIEGFTKKYNITKLVHYEITNDVNSAITREKQIKGWLRSKKIALIESVNPTWEDLARHLDSSALRASE